MLFSEKSLVHCENLETLINNSNNNVPHVNPFYNLNTMQKQILTLSFNDNILAIAESEQLVVYLY